MGSPLRYSSRSALRPASFDGKGDFAGYDDSNEGGTNWMTPGAEIQRVLSRYWVTVTAEIEALGNAGGFSGTRLWRLATSDGLLCLRRWPREHPSRERLAFIHAVLRYVRDRGLTVVPTPLPTRNGETCVPLAGHLWELSPWLPGEPSYRRSPSDEKLFAAMRCLAEFHRHTASFDHEIGIAPGLIERQERFQELSRGRLIEVQAACERPPWQDLARRAERVLSLYHQCAFRVSEHVARGTQCRVAIQPCIRDIWHDHVLFTGDEVTGIVDFGAMRKEHVAADISRLLGSLVGDDRQARANALDAYQSVRKLPDADAALIEVYDQSSLLLSGVNWLQWICLERREFSDRTQVMTRLDEIIARLEHLTAA